MNAKELFDADVGAWAAMVIQQANKQPPDLLADALDVLHDERDIAPSLPAPRERMVA